MIKLERPDCPNPEALSRGDYKHPRNKEALKKATHCKCMYCESKVPHVDFGQIEHIKPKSMNHFPNLEFEWSNLGFVCPKCNNEKSNKYHYDLPYIDPFIDMPSDHFYASGAWLFVKEGSERADITITDVALNRPELIEKRFEKITQIQKTLNACFRTNNSAVRNNALNELAKEAEPEKEYSFFVKALLEAHAA